MIYNLYAYIVLRINFSSSNSKSISFPILFKQAIDADITLIFDKGTKHSQLIMKIEEPRLF